VISAIASTWPVTPPIATAPSATTAFSSSAVNGSGLSRALEGPFRRGGRSTVAGVGPGTPRGGRGSVRPSVRGERQTAAVYSCAAAPCACDGQREADPSEAGGNRPVRIAGAGAAGGADQGGSGQTDCRRARSAHASCRLRTPRASVGGDLRPGAGARAGPGGGRPDHADQALAVALRLTKPSATSSPASSRSASGSTPAPSWPATSAAPDGSSSA